MMKANVFALVASVALWSAPDALAGPITPPPGPVASTPGPEPRIAINATNTRGDSDSLFRIIAPGSYYLTDNITGVPSKMGIEIATHGVTIDLNGFDLLGAFGSLDGIGTSIDSLRNITVVNGSIRNWGGDGLRLSTTYECRVEGVLSSGNGRYGIVIGAGGVIARSAGHSNANHGIVTGDGCTITDCAAYSNTLNGISGGTGCTITGCSTYKNGYNGITTGSDCLVTGCTSTFNGLRGILVSIRGVVTGCNASSNGADGIQCSSGGYIHANNCAGNGKVSSDGAGVRATGADNRIEGNNCTGADRGITIDVAGNLITGNTCSGNTSNWEIAANNKVGPIVASPNSVAISGDTGGAGLGSTNPWANFTY